MEPIWLYDTTLRDGTQGENINFSAREKIRIAQRLDDIGIHYIEGGFPSSNPRDLEFFKRAEDVEFKHARLTAFGSTRRPGIGPEDDPNLKTLIQSNTPAVAIFGKTWDLHVRQILGIGLTENLAMIRESVRFLNENVPEVFYDAEHFFDGYHDNPEYAIETLMAACQGGATSIVLCDTNGGALPFDIETIIPVIQQRLTELAGPGAQIKLGIHTHNDCGLATANTIAGVRSGATIVQGTINGYGERCGNADLTTLAPLLKLKMGYDCMTDTKLAKLKKLSRFVSETANMTPQSNRPFVGKSAFAHKGGVHVSAIMKNPRAYEHMAPELAGNKRRVLISDLAGKSNVEYKARELGVNLNANGANSRQIVSEIKKLEQQGFQFDVADGSFKILLEKHTRQFKPSFDLESFRVTIEKDKDQPCSSHATIKIAVGNKKEITAAEGSGPVSALDNALRKALEKFYPGLDSMGLVDFKVRVIDGREGTAAKVRVLIDSRDKDQIWSTIGVSEDIIEASWQALADSFQFKLSNDDKPDQ